MPLVRRQQRRRLDAPHSGATYSSASPGGGYASG